MTSVPLYCHVPRSSYFAHWVHREKFMQYESVHSSWILFAVEDGSFYYKIGDQEGTATYGDLVFCPPGATFRRVVIRPVTLFVIFLTWRDDQGSDIPLDPGAFPNLKISIRDTARLKADFAMMGTIRKLSDSGAQLKLDHYVYDLWLLYCEECGDHEMSRSLESTGESYDRVAEKAQLMIQAQAFQPVELQKIAGTLGLSLSQLSKKFKKRYGKSPIQYLTSQRLEKAKTLLLETTLTLEQISECCGYQNGFYLNRVFKKHINMTPNEFRSTHTV
ncbi:MAG: AraC family transcriptional regulator [Paenibacillaceae bacterium]|jgi:AraC-like DNA-binding protein|nr:AraC family transcriptional regulator [Paenibacillaceae bacterium]